MDSSLSMVNSGEYVGEWIIICDDKIVAHDKDLAKISGEISKCKHTPTIAKIPKKDTLIF